MKIVKMALAIIVIVALFASGVTFLNSVIPTLAEDGGDDKFQLAPLNPDFIEFLEEPPESFYGYIPPTMDLSHLEGAQEEMALLAQQPSSWDWRDYGKVTTVKDQDTCGTCWAFGTTSVLESVVLLGEGTGYNFSEQSVALCVDRSWVYLYNDADDPCNGGGNSFKASEVFIKKGAVEESCNLYNPGGLWCDGACVCDSCAPVKKVTGYRYVTGDGSQTALIKTAVYNNGPVTMSFYYDPSGEYADGTYGAIYDYYPCSGDSNHLVSIIGWDDDVPHLNSSHSGTGAWLVKNSWGTADSWAGGTTTSDGYFWLAYDSSCMSGIAYLEYGDYNANETLYYWDEIGIWDSAGTGSIETCWMASVFTSAQDGFLTHVDFWTTDEDASYEIYVYNDGDPSNGLQNQLAYQTGSCDEFGYYSIPLITPVPMTNVQQFTVAVEMTTPGYYYPVPIEYVDTGYCEPPIQTGVCFISVDGSVWEDAGDVYDWNVCLRARITSNVDHFKCYSAEGVEPIGEEVQLEDQFGAFNATVGKAVRFCNPVEKEHGGEPTPILNPDHHLTVYNLTCEEDPQMWFVEVDNQFGFGTQNLTVSGPVGLAVPTHKLYPGEHDPPVGLDHYLLYEVIDGLSMGVDVGLEDQFGDDLGVVVGQAVLFANPVQKTHGGHVTDIMNPHEHLVFYEIGGTAAFYPEVQVVDQFGEQTLDLGDPAEWLAVPSEKLIPVPVADKAVSPEDYVQAGQTLDYTVRYDNVGEGTAFGVNVTDVLDEDLDDSTLVIGAGGTYDIPTRTITWLIGEVGPGVGGTLTFSANVRSDATHGTAVTNYATVYFPSVHEEIATNIVVNTVDAVPPTIAGRSPTGSSVSVDSSITIDFSESMDTTSAENAFSISPTVPGSFSWTDDTMTFDPTTNLAYSTAYTVTIDGTAMDSVGNGLDGNENGIAEDSPADDYTWSFTTNAAGGVGGCFIATAAYGTPMAEEIQILREFRDEYLLANPGGQALVGLYYRVSPPIAEFIAEHPSLKPIVRAGLVPAVAMSTVAVNTTPAEKTGIIGLLVLVSVAVAVWAKRRRGREPEYLCG